MIHFAKSVSYQERVAAATVLKNMLYVYFVKNSSCCKMSIRLEIPRFKKRVHPNELRIDKYKK